MYKKNILPIICVSALLGIFALCFPGPSFVMALSGLICLVIWHYSPEDERKFILGIFVTALAVRFFVSLVYYILSFKTGFSVDFYGDARGYSHSGLYISYVFGGKDFTDMNLYDGSFNDSLRSTFFYLVSELKQFKGGLPPINFYRTGGFAYLIGLIYSIFGYTPLTIKFLNCLLMGLTGLIVYDISKKVFSIAIARFACVITLFFPSMFVWSITGLKDSIIIFTMTLLLWSFVKLQESIRIWNILLIGACIKLLDLFQAGKVSLVFIAIAGIILFKNLKFKLRYKVMSLSLLALSAAITLLIIKRISPSSELAGGFDIASILSGQVGFVVSGGNTYRIFPIRCYSSYTSHISLIEFFFSYLKGFLYFLFAPFPKHGFQSFPILLSMCEMLVLYAMAPFALIGVIMGLRYRAYKVIDILIFVFILISAFSLVEGNIGTVFRHRSFVLPAIFIFASAGFIKIFTNSKVLNDKN